jgi:hypothetical protein
MNRRFRSHLFCSLLQAIVVLVMMHLAAYIHAAECDYDRSHPSLNSASGFMEELNWACARAELNDLLANTATSEHDKADAHVMLAIIYYRTIKEYAARSDSVLTEFLNALDKNPGITPRLDIDSLGLIFSKAKDSAAHNLDFQNKKICLKYQHDRSVNRTLKLVTGIAFVGVATGFVVFEGKSNSAYDRYKSSVSPDDIQSNWDDYNSNFKMRNVMIGAAAGFALLEALWFKQAPHKPDIDCKPYIPKFSAINLGFDPIETKVRLTIWIPGT